MRDKKIKVLITAIVGTSGNDYAYLGLHIGNRLIKRPLTKVVVTFLEELDELELEALNSNIEFRQQIVQEFRSGVNAVQLYSLDYQVVP